MEITSPIRFALAISALIAILAAIGWKLVWSPNEEPLPDTPVVKFADRPSRAPLEILIVTEAKTPLEAADNPTSPTTSPVVPPPTAHTYLCHDGTCTAGQRPQNIRSAVTDGEWWYYYQLGDIDQRGFEKVYLKRVRADGSETQTLMESTPLTSPRDLFISPNGQHVAFWLDNIDQPEEQLTELWVYDVDDGGVRLLAEKIYAPDVRSPVRWNKMATQLFFIADTGERTAAEDRLELIVVTADAPGKRAAYPDVTWSDIVAEFTDHPLDLSRTGEHLAVATKNFLNQQGLELWHNNERERNTVRGIIKHIQWLEDDSLLYAVQDDDGFAFWRVKDGTHRFVARRPGQLTSALSDLQGEHIAFSVQTSPTTITIYSMHIDSGLVSDEGTLTDSASGADIVHVRQQPPEPTAAASEVTAELDDAEIAAFIERNFKEIVTDPAATPLRLIMTEEPNTIFLDYRLTPTMERRILLKIHDAVHTEWSIKGRYEPLNREWKKVEGGGLADPKPTRLYEWEDNLNQWILKENYQ